jgi:uncharacterized membrane protein YeaQ/YmgE (transglycosylase-associated protein family)
MGILAWILFGLVVGLVARFLIPGRQPMGLMMTTLLGVAGSLVGGFLASLLFHAPYERFHPAGLLGSVIGALLLLIIVGGMPRRSRLWA